MSGDNHTGFSDYGLRLTRGSGILDLMHDLGSALSGTASVHMLGGGNPSHIPAMEALFLERMQELVGNPPALARLLGDYSPPQGDPGFIAALAGLLRSRYGWDVGPEHIALTSGSQASFFSLFNLFAGPRAGTRRRVLLPMVPEYIGYGDVTIDPEALLSLRPIIEELSGRTFKYHIDFEALAQVRDVGAICVSRPTNPTGNMLTDQELQRLREHAAAMGVPLIVDCAYGLPFPGIAFTDATPMWDENMIVCLSLSKLGLPAVRSGIVIGAPEVISAIAGMNAVLNLAPGAIGPAIVQDLIASGRILEIAQDIIRPWYEQRARQALDWLHRELHGLEYRVHRAEGAMFLWLWLPGLPITSAELYRRLKERGVIVVPGHHFFSGFDEPWTHRDECLRVSFAQPEASVQAGLRIIAEEVARATRQKG